MCTNFSGHDWKKIGAERVPAHGMYYQGMPLEPTGTVEYEYFRCQHCGEESAQERLYSYRSSKGE